MKFGLRVLGILDLLTFLIFISAKTSHLLATFQFPFPMSAKVVALWEIIVLFFFLKTAILLWIKPKSGLFFSFLLIPFRIVFIYYSFDFLSYLSHYFNISTFGDFQNNWFYTLFFLESLRYMFSFYVYYKLIK